MQPHHYRSGFSRLLPLLFLLIAVTACGDSDDGPATPSPTPPPAGSAAIIIENFAATSTPGPGGTFNYRASLRLRETGGAAATITGVTLTLTTTSGLSVARDVSPAEAFPTTTVGANGILQANPLSVTGAPVEASQVAIRVTFAAANGTTGTVQATTNVTAE